MRLEVRSRRGVIVPLTAILLIVLFGLVAFAVDIGWVAVAQSDLQNAADSSALAGIDPLMDGCVQYNLPNQTAQKQTSILTSAQSSACAKAKQYAQSNSAGGVSALTLLDADIEFGFLDAANKYTPCPTYKGYPNTIRVTLRRDKQANGALGLFFGPVLGVRTTDLIVTASATIYTGTLDSLSISKANMLPLAYDSSHWNNFLKTGKDPDGNITTDASGAAQLSVFASSKYKGNFGYLSLSNSNVGASTEKSWITDGVPSGDVKALIADGLIPLSKHDDKKWDWQGSTGFKSTLVQTINAETGNSFVLPTFKAFDSSSGNYQAGSGKGSNYFYNVVEFVGVKVTSPANEKKDILVQPAAIVEPDSMFLAGSVKPAGTTSGLVTTFATPKLSR